MSREEPSELEQSPLFEQRTRFRGYEVRLVREPVGDAPPAYTVRSARDVYRFLGWAQGCDRESFYSLHLDARHRITSYEEVSRGVLSGSPVHPREVYKAAILSSAAAIVVAHNHPSGDPNPSSEDRDVTSRLREAGELLGIPLLDHVVIGHARWFSIAEDRLYVDSKANSP